MNREELARRRAYAEHELVRLGNTPAAVGEGLAYSARSPVGLIAIVCAASMAAFCLAMLLRSAPQAQAATPAGYLEYYIPGAEEQLWDILVDMDNYDPDTPNNQLDPNAGMHAVISVVAMADNTTVYYDHWEDGYDFDPDNPASTADETVLLDEGEVSVFESSGIPIAPRGTSEHYDGRDRLYVAGGTVTVNRASWSDSPGASTLYALAWEIYPTKPWMTSYTIPVGEDLYEAPQNLGDFQNAYVIVQATSDDTEVEIDDPGSSGIEVDTTIDQGEVTDLYHIDAGTTVSADKPVQVQFIVGTDGIRGHYEMRGFTAVPQDLWDDEYYAVVGSFNSDSSLPNDSDAYIYNPSSTTSLTISWQDSTGSGSFSVATGATVSFGDTVGHFIPNGSALYLSGSHEFWGISSVDTEDPGHDWGYSLIPVAYLRSDYTSGWAPSTLDENAQGSPLWVTATSDNTTVYVDFSPTDGTVDETYNLDRLDVAKIWDPDYDNTGTHFWATAPFAAVWGEDADTAGASYNFLDMGYTTLPVPEEGIEAVIEVEKTVEPVVLLAGQQQTVAFTLVTSIPGFDADDLWITDTLPAGFTYVEDTTYITKSTGTTITPTASEPDTSGSDLVWDSDLLGDVSAGEIVTITFEASTASTFEEGDVAFNIVHSSVTRTVNGAFQSFTARDSALNAFTRLEIVKSADTGIGPLGPSDRITYTVVVTNSDSAAFAHHDIQLTDLVPEGTSYVEDTAEITVPLEAYVRDEFEEASFANNDGTVEWLGDWIEVDGNGSGAESGSVRVQAGELWFNDEPDTGGEPSAARELDALGYTSAVLTFGWRTTSGVDTSDAVVLEASDDGGSNYTTLETFTGLDGENSGSGRYLLEDDISLTANVRIRFRVSNLYGGTNEWFVVDDVDISLLKLKTVRDEFGSVSYSNNDGTEDWLGDWTENDAGGGGPSGGNIRVLSSAEVLRLLELPSGDYVERSVDLAGYYTARLSFDWEVSDLEEVVTVLISQDGISFEEVASFSGQSSSGTGDYDITDFIGPNTTVRFGNVGGDWNYPNDIAYFDNVQIGFASRDPVEMEGGDPPDLLSPLEEYIPSYTLFGGETFTATFTVVIDEPIPLNLEEIENTACLSSYELVRSLCDTVVDPIPPADIGDRVWLDEDGDGVQDPGEGGLPGVVIELYDSDSTLVLTTTTGVDGSYLFDDIPPGSYTVAVDSDTLPGFVTGTPTYDEDDGTTAPDGSAAVTVAGNDVHLTADFGYTRPGSIGDYVWLDADSDGVQDGAEGGISGVDLGLYIDDGDGVFEPGTDDVLAATTTTDAEGRYRFDGLPPGDYWVDVDASTLPSGLSATTGTVDPQGTLSLSPGEDYADADFGYASTTQSAVGDRVWYDEDADGVQDTGEVGIGGVTVFIDENDNGVLDPGEPSDVTDVDGSYLITGLSAATYDVTVDVGTLPSGYDTTPTNGATSRDILVPAGVDVLYADYGFTAPAGTTGSIGDTVFFDADGDGLQAGPAETGIAGVTVNLLDSSGNVLATTVTDSDGKYDFVGVPAGSYQVEVTDVDGVLDGLNLTAGTNPTATIALSAGQDYNDADFPYGPPAGSIGNTVWHDVDGDGVYERAGADGIVGTSDDETPMEGVTVDLYWDVNGNGVLDVGTDVLVRTEASDVNGRYLFSDLAYDSVGVDYLVSVTDSAGVLAGMSKTTGSPGSDNNSQADPYAVTLSDSSAVNYTADFGYDADEPLSISGVTFTDNDNDGLWEGNPPDVRIPTLEVYLYRDLDGDERLSPGDALIATQLSDEYGYYEFTDLPPGDYVVAVNAVDSRLDGFFQTTQTTTDAVQPVTLTTADSENNDFGFYAPGGSQTTPVTLAYFNAATHDGRTRIEWSTATEVGNVGFNIYAVREDGSQRLNDRLILGHGGDTLAPQDYAFEMAGAAGESFAIEDVDVLGRTRWHGVFESGAQYGAPPEVEVIDWAAVNAEHAAMEVARFGKLAEAVNASVAGWLASRESAGAEAAGLAGDEAVANPGLDGVCYERGGAPRSGAAPERLRGPTDAVAVAELRVDRDGVYRVTHESLMDVGIDLSGVPAGALALTVGGRAVPIYLESGPGDVLGPDFAFEFVGEQLDTLYTETNVYVLHIAPSMARRVAQVDSAPPPGAEAAAYYMATSEIDNDVAYSYLSPSGDPWYEAQIVAQEGPRSYKAELSLDEYVAGAAAAELSVGLWGVTNWPAKPDHHVVLELNGRAVADEHFDGLVDHPITLELPAGALQDGVNDLTVSLPHDLGLDYDVVILDRYRVTYPRRFVARDGALVFDAAGAVFGIAGMPGGDVAVYRVREGAVGRVSPVETEAEAGGGNYVVSFAGDEVPARYYVAADSVLLSPQVSPARAEVALATGDAEYLVIAHPDFIAGIQPLVEAREADGLSTRVVDVQDIYTRHGNRIFSADAIRAYVSSAVRHQGTRYVLLVGGDSYDYLDRLGLGSRSFIPSPYAQTDRLVHYAPVDALYGDVDGDGMPEIPVGRLPVRSTEELRRVVAKTLAYDAKDYERTAVFAADELDPLVDFTADSEDILETVPDEWEVIRVYLDEVEVHSARRALIGAINEGVALTSFIGHSGPAHWSFRNLFTGDDAAALANPGRPTVVTQWGCWNTYHSHPKYSTLGHKLLLSGENGAAAVLGAATLTESTSEAVLGRLVAPHLTRPGVRLGDAVLYGKQQMPRGVRNYADVLLGWTILGDPALQVER